jgi:hypothetical protein
MTFTETKFENVILHMLFGACMVVCALILTAMVANRPAPVELATKMTLNNAVGTLLASAPSACALQVSNKVCVGTAG